MSVLEDIKQRLTGYFIGLATDQRITNEFAMRHGKEALGHSKATGIVPETETHRIVQLKDWVSAINAARNVDNPARKLYYQVCRSTMLDLHLHAAWDHRVVEVQSTEYVLIDPNGERDEKAIKLFDAKWFLDFVRWALEKNLYGHSLIELTAMAEKPIQVELNRGKTNVLPIKELKLVPRQHVKPEYGVWVKLPDDDPKKGFSYLNPPDSNYYLSIGTEKDLGALERIAPAVLAKRFAIAAWTEYNEKIGIPFRWVKMAGTDKKREGVLARIMQAMGSAGWGVLHPGEELNFLADSKGDPHKCFMELCLYLDKQVSKAILGQTMTMDDGSSRSQAEVHQEVADMRYWSDVKFIEAVVNEQLIPLLVTHGYPLEGYTFMRDDKKELPIKDQVIVDTLLLQHYNIAPAYIAERYGIPEDQIEAKREIQPPTNEDPDTPANPPNKPPMTPPNKPAPPNPKNEAPQPQPGSGAHQQGCTCRACTGEYLDDDFYANAPTMQSVPGEEQIEQALSQLYGALWDGNLKQVQIPANVALARSQVIWNGFKSKLSERLAKPDLESPDNLRIALFEANVNRYSCAATLAEWQLLNQAAANSSTFTDFERKAKQLIGKTNTYLRTEYDTAVATSQNASNWVRQQAEKNQFDLMFDAIVDGGTTEGCLNLNGLVRPATDPIWGRIYPPNHWRCRSEVLQVAKGSRAYTDENPDISWIKDGFNINRGDANVVFAWGQGYLKKQFNAAKLKAKNYGLPPELPKNDLQANLPEESQKNYEAWWLKNQQPNGQVYLKNHHNLAIELPIKLKTKFTKAEYSGQNRQGIATNLLSEILANPDEVWVNENNAKGAPSQLRHVYLKRYGNDTFAAITDNLKALTWYKADYPDALFQVRKGILTHKKSAGTEPGT